MAQLVVSPARKKLFKEHLSFIYGERKASKIFDSIMKIMTLFAEGQEELRIREEKKEKEAFEQNYNLPPSEYGMDADNIMLITYPDQFSSEKMRPLEALCSFMKNNLDEVIRSVHILPFFPYSSDHGFSVIDYKQVDPRLGSWNSIKDISKYYDLMVDGVVNHISKDHNWFKKYCRGDSKYKNYFIEVDPKTDISSVIRPRTSPLLTKINTSKGIKHVWTTFSADQVDLNFAEPAVLLEIIELMLFYYRKGARFIRLDAIGFIWKEIGTSSLHHPKTHKIIQLLRLIFDCVADDLTLITETNVPHKDNISYFGNGENEAKMVYQFALPSLLLHTLYTGEADILSKWIDSLDNNSQHCSFLNFLASHDGIGLNGVKDILDENEISNIIDNVKKRGGLMSEKTNKDGSTSPYELNISLLNALSDNENSEDENIARFICAHAILLSLKGVPAIYIHSLLGSQNFSQGVKETGDNRAINRETFTLEKIQEEIKKEGSLRHAIFRSMCKLLNVRRRNRAFDPLGKQKVFFLDKRVFAVLRYSPWADTPVLALHNVSRDIVELSIDSIAVFSTLDQWHHDILGDEAYPLGRDLRFHTTFGPYQSRWIIPIENLHPND